MKKESIDILLVDDDPGACELVQRILAGDDEPLEYKLETAENLVTATQALRRKRFDNVLLELALDDSSGVDTVRRIREVDAEVPIIVLSAPADQETAIRTIQEGADYYLVKSDDVSRMLGRSIRCVIEHKRAERRRMQRRFENRRKSELPKSETAEDQVKATQAQIEHVNRQLATSVQRANMFAQEAMAASRVKSEFLANMAHEVRTPINSIIGFTDLLAEEELTDEQKKYINILQRSAANLLDLINDILDLSRIEAGRVDIEMIPCSPAKLLAEIADSMEVMAKQKALAFEVCSSPDLPASILTDPTRLRQCLTNLVSNAIKFTEDGHVHVDARLEKGGEHNWIRFDVADTGIGIEADKQEAIFEAFSQARADTTRKFGGSGLGLAITRKLAELLGGKIQFVSEPGEGSVFSLMIPAQVDALAEAPAAGKENE